MGFFLTGLKFQRGGTNNQREREAAREASLAFSLSVSQFSERGANGVDFPLSSFSTPETF
jgi:hypothetical protein